MKNKIFLLFIISSVIFSSCQKVIDIDLKDAAQHYIVDAFITDEQYYNGISIIKSKNFNEDNNFDTIANAKVWIVNQTTNEKFEFENSPTNKIFKNNSIIVKPSNTYQLYIKIENDTLTSVCDVPSVKVVLDSLIIKKSEFSAFLGQDIFECVPIYKDPVGRGNYYFIKPYINGQTLVSSGYDSDEFIDGQVNKSAINFKPFDAENEDFKQFVNGDTLTVELFNISKPVYEFYSTLSLNSSSIISNPANPKSNVKGKNTIGVFKAATISRKSIIASY